MKSFQVIHLHMLTFRCLVAYVMLPHYAEIEPSLILEHELASSLVIHMVLKVTNCMIWPIKPIFSLEMSFSRNLFFPLKLVFLNLYHLLHLLIIPCFPFILVFKINQITLSLLLHLYQLFLLNFLHLSIFVILLYPLMNSLTLFILTLLCHMFLIQFLIIVYLSDIHLGCINLLLILGIVKVLFLHLILFEYHLFISL